ncbi:MAG: prepilin-type N-terminal cleavage/methylation domain-containing protein [Candidatus Hydrogenedentes bacterium]|nr:prepilin-type N-terminal cleavage/methylation domain-containing protein [Candidatus Hydrogenedentota bacterium]
MRATHDSAGFTLLELMVVVTIITVFAAGVLPVYQGSLSRIRGARATHELVATVKHCQERAITEGVEYRLYLDDEENSYWVKRLAKRDAGDKVFASPPGLTGQKRRLPEKTDMSRPSARRDRDEDAYYVAFYPNGACDYATIKLRRADRKRVTISTKGRLGQLEVDE